MCADARAGAAHRRTLACAGAFKPPAPGKTAGFRVPRGGRVRRQEHNIVRGGKERIGTARHPRREKSLADALFPRRARNTEEGFGDEVASQGTTAARAARRSHPIPSKYMVGMGLVPVVESGAGAEAYFVDAAYAAAGAAIVADAAAALASPTSCSRCSGR